MVYFTKIARLYRKYIRDRGKEAKFLVLVSFTLMFLIARITVYGITYNFLPSFLFGYIVYKDVHIHHLVFGIILLLLAGLIRVPQDDDNLIRFSSILYGIGAALTLDEFSLWLNLDPDVYFGPEGRISVDAVAIFILVMLLTLWYGNFWSKVFGHTIAHFFKKNKVKSFLFMKKKVLPLLAGIFLLLFGATLLFSMEQVNVLSVNKKPQQQKTVLHLKKPAVHVLAANTINNVSPTPSVSPSPTISPTVTAQPTVASTNATIESANSGYCLNVPVLMYHHVSPNADAVARRITALNVDNGAFDLQMGYLASHGYSAVTAEQLINALRSHSGLPPKSVVITLDDGYVDNYTYAYPTLKKYGLKATIMVATGLLGINTATNSYFTWDQLREMVNSGVISVGDHTWSHYPLGTGSGEKNQFEIMTAKQQLEQNLGKTVTVFTYPYGAGKSTPWVIDLLKKDGFTGAYSTIGGTMQCDSYIMALHRNRVGNSLFPGYGIY